LSPPSVAFQPDATPTAAVLAADAAAFSLRPSCRLPPHFRHARAFTHATPFEMTPRQLALLMPPPAAAAALSLMPVSYYRCAIRGAEVTADAMVFDYYAADMRRERYAEHSCAQAESARDA
jgi:hypothetical protein